MVIVILFSLVLLVFFILTFFIIRGVKYLKRPNLRRVNFLLILLALFTSGLILVGLLSSLTVYASYVPYLLRLPIAETSLSMPQTSLFYKSARCSWLSNVNKDWSCEDNWEGRNRRLRASSKIFPSIYVQLNIGEEDDEHQCITPFIPFGFPVSPSSSGLGFPIVCVSSGGIIQKTVWEQDGIRFSYIGHNVFPWIYYQNLKGPAMGFPDLGIEWVDQNEKLLRLIQTEEYFTSTDEMKIMSFEPEKNSLKLQADDKYCATDVVNAQLNEQIYIAAVGEDKKPYLGEVEVQANNPCVINVQFLELSN